MWSKKDESDMKILFQADKTIGQIQDEFHTLFPHLKLGFFTRAHEAFKSTSPKYLISDRNTLLGAISPALADKPFEYIFTPATTVRELEDVLENTLGLHLQLFRQSGNAWLETSVTDGLPLAEQEQKAIDSLYVHQEFVDPMDYREQD